MGINENNIVYSSDDEMISVEEIEKLFSANQARAKTPDISFDATQNISLNDIYTPTEFIPLNEDFEDPPTTAPTPSSLGSPPPKVLIGKASRFIPGRSTSSDEGSLNLESPEREKVGFFTKKRKIFIPLDYEHGDTDWQYNSYLREYQFKPGMDIYTTKICQFEIEAKLMEQSQTTQNDSE